MKRRDALKFILGTGVTLAAEGCTLFKNQKSAPIQRGYVPPEADPLDVSLGDTAGRHFFGDQNIRPHAYLRKALSFKPAKFERRDVVVVGGGVSGLASAYLLRKYNPILLEQAAQFGGNAKGQVWNHTSFSMGAAYIEEPDEDSEIYQHFRELGLTKKWRVQTHNEPVLLKGKLVKNVLEQAEPKLHQLLSDIYEEKHGRVFPNIPFENPGDEAYIHRLDQKSFRAFLESELGHRLDPKVDRLIEYYCWSSFGSSASEISAASGLNFYACETGNACVLPGGNAGYTSAVYQKLSAELGKDSLRSQSLVLKIQTESDHVLVDYISANDEFIQIRAKKVVVACPKYVAKRIISNVEPSRLKAIDSLRYRSYLVACVLLRSSVKNPYYDVYYTKEEPLNLSNIRDEALAQRATDVVCGSFSSQAKGQTVLTLYRGLPYDSGRSEIFDDERYEVIRKEFETQVAQEILPVLGFSDREIVDIRIARWGHPMPVSYTGFYKMKVYEELKKPIQNKIFFSNQDNFALPAIEVALTEAMRTAQQITSLLRT